MKKILSLTLLVLFLTSCASRKTIQMADGTYITKRQQKNIFEKAWNDSFGKMTDEEMELMDGVQFTVDTIHP